MRQDLKRDEDGVQERIRSAVECRDDEMAVTGGRHKDRFKRNFDYLYGKQRPSDWGEEDYVINNVLDVSTDVIVDGLTIAKSKHRGEARDRQSEPIARLAASILDTRSEELHIDHEYKKVLVDYLTMGYGAVMQGWMFHDEGTDEEKAKLEADNALPPGQFEQDTEGQIAHVHVSDETGQLEAIPMPVASFKMRKVALIDENYLVHIPCEDLYFDPAEIDFNTLDNSTFFVWRERRKVGEIRADKRNDPDVDLSENLIDDEDNYPVREEDREVELFNYFGYDPENPNKLIHSVRTARDYVKIRTVPWPFHYWPIRVMADNIKPGDHYPISRVERCIPDQDLVNLTETQLNEHRKQWDATIFVDKQAWTTDVAKKYKEARGATAIPVQVGTGGESLKDKIFKLPGMALQPEVYNVRNEAAQRIRTRLGVTEYQLGQFPEGNRLATEVIELSNQSGVRAKALGARFRLYRTANAKLMLEIIKDNLEPGSLRSVQWFNAQGAQLWAEFTSTMLQGDYGITVEVSDEMFDTPQASQQKWGTLLQVLTPYTQGATDQVTGQPTGIVNPKTGKPYIVDLAPIIERYLLASGVERPADLMVPSPEQEARDAQMQQFLQQGGAPSLGGTVPPPGAAPPPEAAQQGGNVNPLVLSG